MGPCYLIYLTAHLVLPKGALSTPELSSLTLSYFLLPAILSLPVSPSFVEKLYGWLSEKWMGI